MAETPITASFNPDPLVQEITSMEVGQGRVRRAIGVGMIAGAAALAASMGSEEGLNFLHLPFSDHVMGALDSLDDVLAKSGEIGLVGAVAIVGAAKLLSSRASKVELMDLLSSREMSPEAGDHRRGSGFLRRTLERVSSGKFPVIAFTGAMLASLTSAIGTEVTEGPTRPIQSIEQYLPGGDHARLIVQNKSAMPMVHSALSEGLTRRVLQEAGNEGVRAMPIAENLSTLSVNGNDRTALTFGVGVPKNSRLDWSPDMGCTAIPVLVDDAAGIRKGAGGIELQGSSAEVVGTIKNMSAINRVGVVADIEAVEDCLQKNSTSHAIALDASAEQAHDILAAADSGLWESATVISMDQYKQNSEEFWKKNVKPITNILALLSGMMTFVAISGDIALRIARSRRELGMLLASGDNSRILQGAEFLRALKDGIVAATTGAASAALATSAVSTAVYGMHPVVNMREAMVGAGTVLLGSVGAVLRKAGSLKRLTKSVDPANSTRI